MASQNIYDGIVATSGGDYTDIQSADNALDTGAYTLYVKSGTYTSGFTVSTNNVEIWFEPSVIIQDDITLSGDNICLNLGACCDIQGDITLSGSSCSLRCQNGCTLDLVTCSCVLFR